jgi:hypothetical protein
MKRKAPYPLQKVTLNLRRGDFDRLRVLHGRRGAGKVIRELVIGHLGRVDTAVAQKMQLELPLEEI